MPSQSATLIDPPTYVPTYAPTDQLSEAPSESPSDMPSSAPTVELSGAIFYPPAGVPFCQEVLAGCDSGALLNSRGSVSPAESNAPNTLDGCPDGNSGTYYSDESLERIKVVSVGNGVLRKGTTVEIQATVYAWSDGSSDTADFYYIADATNSSLLWQYIGSLVPSGGGIQTLTQQYVLPTGSGNVIQAVRVNFRFGGSVSPCTSGGFDDRDDLAFAVADSLPLSTEENEYGAHGVMFDVYAEHKLRIDSFDVFSAYNQTNSTVKLYTRAGRYSGFEVSSEGWELVQDDYVDFLGQDLPTTILVDVTIPAASFQSFFIWSENVQIMYDSGTLEGSLHSSNAYVEFYEGVGIVSKFSGDLDDVKSPRILKGMIGFEVLPTSQPSASPSMLPSAQPSAQPTSTPSTEPSSQPSTSPSNHPSSEPSSSPSSQPSSNPNSFPSSSPSSHPSSEPSSSPSSQPSSNPSSFPSSSPSSHPSSELSSSPSSHPLSNPSSFPSSSPSSHPSSEPSSSPSSHPSSNPSSLPSSSPSSHPSSEPSSSPSSQPSSNPSSQPSLKPSSSPSDLPSLQPSNEPTSKPSMNPSSQPTSSPSSSPSLHPSLEPTVLPSAHP